MLPELFRRHASLTRGLALAAALNGVLIVALLWSQGGQSTHIRVEAQGNRFSAYVDGRLVASAIFHPPDRGGVYVALNDTEGLPSLPTPRGIDSVSVTDLVTGEMLFQDDFADGPGPQWGRQGDLRSRDGVVGVDGTGVLTLSGQDWHDYAVDIRYRNVIGGSITVRTEDGLSGVVYRFGIFRDTQSDLSLRESGTTVAGVSGGTIQPRPLQSVKALVAMALHAYPFTALVVVLAFLLVLPLQYGRMPRRGWSSRWVLSWSSQLAAVALTAFAFGSALFLNFWFGSRMPHIPDEISYMFQAKLLASGRVFASPPPVGDVFDYFSPSYIAVSHGKWASVYPFGHPLLLAIGVKLRAVWLVPPLLGAATVAMLFVVGQRIYHARLALLAALLLAVSPFFLMMTSSFMSHTTAAFYLLASMLCLVFIERRPLLYGFLAGVFFGLLFNTRPLTAVALIPSFGLLLVSLSFPPKLRTRGLPGSAAFVLGGLVMLGAFLLYNYGTNGDAFTSGYGVQFQPTPGVSLPGVSCAGGGCGNLAQGVGFGGRHTVAAGIQNEKTQLALLLLVLNGWPTYVGLTFLLLPFVLATRNLWDWFLLSCILSVMAATVVFEGTGIAFGPRYWYDIVPLIMLLSARGAERAAETVAVAAGFVRRAVSPSGTQTPSWAAAVVVYALVLSLIGGEVYGWVLGQRAGWRDISFSLGDGLQATFVPESASLLRGFNGVDDRLVTLVDGADLHNALVLVEPCPNWQCYGNLAWLNSPDLNGDVVFAKDLPERRAELFKVYADRRVYVADYLKSSLAPYGAASTSDTGRPLAEAPLAKNISSQPTPVATAVPADAGRRDEERRQDLALVAQSLELYFEKHKVYPVAPTLQALCGTPLNAGCALKEVLDPLPVDPAPGGTYSYQSDGTSFILVAFLEAGSAADACPDPPQQLRIFTNLYCVGSRSSSTP